MTSWELRAWIVLRVAKLLRVKMRDLYESYPYNPHVDEEILYALKRGRARSTCDSGKAPR